ncbi:MAG: PQQ-binding-like beta-propeller repeat protein [Nanoarchaeota archaeon]|nr:PQQ-binding-like beta-propeller repeat protein [Nanoarchaeota archaeon]
MSYIDPQDISTSITIDTGEFGDIQWLARFTEMAEVAQEFPVLWEIGVGGAVTTTPVAHNGVIYVGAADKNFYAIDAETGQEQWRFTTNGPILSYPTLVGETLYFSSFDYNLYALTLTGTLKWKFATKGKIFSKPAVSNNVIYIGSEDRNLYAINADGSLKWTFQTKDTIHSSPLVYKDRIFFGSFDNNFYCLNLEGELLWTFPTKGVTTVFEICAVDGIVYFNSWDRNLYAVDIDGKLVWKRTLIEPLNTSIVYADGLLYAASRSKHVYAIDAKTGDVRWRKEADSFFGETGTYHNGVLYIGNCDQTVYALDAKTGNEIWRFKTTGMFAHSRPVIWGNKLYIGCWNDCKLFCINLDGTLAWTFKTTLSQAPEVFPEQNPRARKIEFKLKPEEAFIEETHYKTGQGEEQDFSGRSSMYIIKSEYTTKHRYATK